MPRGPPIDVLARDAAEPFVHLDTDDAGKAAARGEQQGPTLARSQIDESEVGWHDARSPDDPPEQCNGRRHIGLGVSWHFGREHARGVSAGIFESIDTGELVEAAIAAEVSPLRETGN